jgi:hypothetical protein
MRRPVRAPPLRALISLTLHAPLSSTSLEAFSLCVFARLVVGKARALERIVLITQDADPRTPGVAHDSLLQHLAARHAQTLREVCMRECFVREHALRNMFSTCRKLRRVEIAVDRRVLVSRGSYCRAHLLNAARRWLRPPSWRVWRRRDR